MVNRRIIYKRTEDIKKERKNVKNSKIKEHQRKELEQKVQGIEKSSQKKTTKIKSKLKKS